MFFYKLFFALHLLKFVLVFAGSITVIQLKSLRAKVRSPPVGKGAELDVAAPLPTGGLLLPFKIMN